MKLNTFKKRKKSEKAKAEEENYAMLKDEIHDYIVTISERNTADFSKCSSIGRKWLEY